MKHECKSCLIALGDETRVNIYYHLLKSSLCVNDLKNFLNLSQSTVSYHLNVLVGQGLLTKVEQGRKSIFSINHDCPFYKTDCVLTKISN